METTILNAIANIKLDSKLDSKWKLECSEVFGNPLILSNLFSQVASAQDLKQIRLVCRLWRDVSIDQWRTIGTLCLMWRNWRELEYCPCKYCERSTFPSSSSNKDFYKGGMEIAEYLELLKASKLAGASCPTQLWKKPFTRFRLGYCSLFNPNGRADDGSPLPPGYGQQTWDDLNLEKLWSECGRQMKYLHFDHLIVFNAKYFKIFRWILSERLPNLEELAMVIAPARYTNLADVERRHEQGRLDGYRELGFPVGGPARKLKSISLELCRNWKRWDLWDINEHMTMLPRHLPNVKNVKVDSRISAHFLQGLINPTSSGEIIKLASLTILARRSANSETFVSLKEYIGRVQPPITTPKVGIDLTWIGYGSLFHEFLRSTLKSLRHLELDHHPTAIKGRSLSKQLTTFHSPHLTKPYLYGEAMISFRALKGLPNLQTLWVKSDHSPEYNWNERVAGEANDEEITERKLLWEKVTLLHMDYSRFTSDSLKSFGRWMPNLEEIQLVLGMDSSSVVRNVWPELVKLTEL